MPLMPSATLTTGDITTKRLRRGVCTSVPELVSATNQPPLGCAERGATVSTACAERGEIYARLQGLQRVAQLVYLRSFTRWYMATNRSDVMALRGFVMVWGVGADVWR